MFGAHVRLRTEVCRSGRTATCGRRRGKRHDMRVGQREGEKKNASPDGQQRYRLLLVVERLRLFEFQRSKGALGQTIFKGAKSWVSQLRPLLVHAVGLIAH
jgi:hypothetical protein